MQRERGPGRHRRPPARLPARNSRLRPRARAHWLRLAAGAARTGRPARQSPARAGGGAPCRGGFLFARACARNNERDRPRARGLPRPGPARGGGGPAAALPRRRDGATRPAGPGRPPARAAGVGAEAQLRGGRALPLPVPSPPPPPYPPLPPPWWRRGARVCPGDAGLQPRSFELALAGVSLTAAASRGSGPGAELRPASSQRQRQRRRALSPPALRCRRVVPRGAGRPARAGPAWRRPRAAAGCRSPRGRPPLAAGRGLRVSAGLWPAAARPRRPHLNGRPRGPLHKLSGRRGLAPGSPGRAKSKKRLCPLCKVKPVEGIRPRVRF